jgi:predicted transcriptional regulator
VGQIIADTTHPGAGEGDDGAGGGNDKRGAPGLADGLIEAMTGTGGLVALAALGITGLAGAGFLLATRYVDPKEALENPQRAMLYGYVRGNPGVNLKTLSDDFDMKTSTVLWHIRKLEGAELVRSTKANGFRVFYPVAGGIEAKNLGSAVAALANGNASRILDYIAIHPGVQQRGLVNALDINAGTVRWHLRKLKDTGLMAELSQGRSSTYYPTELGIKALRQTMGLSSDVKPVPDLVATANATAP